MKRLPILFLLAIGLVLASCSSAQSITQPQPTNTPGTKLPDRGSGLKELQLSEKNDEQGAVTINIKPQAWVAGSDTLDFEVALNTHSVDLNFDLSELSTLKTDTGITIPATKWSAPPGGHHVSGMLSFSAYVGGKPVLDDINQLTLTIENVDIPERVFTWELFR